MKNGRFPKWLLLVGLILLVALAVAGGVVFVLRNRRKKKSEEPKWYEDESKAFSFEAESEEVCE